MREPIGGNGERANKPLAMSSDELDIYSRFIADKAEKWSRIDPDVVFVCESAALPLAHGIKQAFKIAYPESKTAFRRLDARSFPSPWSYSSAASYSFVEQTDLPKSSNIERIASYADARSMNERKDQRGHVSSLRAEAALKGNLGSCIIFDESHMFSLSKSETYQDDDSGGSKEPVKILEKGELTERAKQILSQSKQGRTLRSAFVYAQRLGFQDVWFDASSPHNYFSQTSSRVKYAPDEPGKEYFGSISTKGAIGPIHATTHDKLSRLRAVRAFHDFKLAGRLAGKMIRDRGAEKAAS